MTKEDAYEVGLKVMGIYFSLSGIIALITSLVWLLKYLAPNYSIDTLSLRNLLFGLIGPIAQLALGILLLRKTGFIIAKVSE